MENGRDFQIPSFLYEPTTLAERLYVLRKILKQNQEDNRTDFLLKASFLSAVILQRILFSITEKIWIKVPSSLRRIV